MLHGNVHAAEIAHARGYPQLSAQMRKFWTTISRSGGYKRFNALQAERGRFVILRQRYADQANRLAFVQTECPEGFKGVLEWLLVLQTGGCPARPLRIIMGFWEV